MTNMIIFLPRYSTNSLPFTLGLASWYQYLLQKKDEELEEALNRRDDAQARLAQEQQRRQLLTQEKASLEAQLRAAVRAADDLKEKANQEAASITELSTQNEALLAQLQEKSQQLELMALHSARPAEIQQDPQSKELEEEVHVCLSCL